MGLFPDAPAQNPGVDGSCNNNGGTRSAPSSPRHRFLTRSNSLFTSGVRSLSSASKNGGDSYATIHKCKSGQNGSSMQQLSTSWTFLRPALDFNQDESGSSVADKDDAAALHQHHAVMSGVGIGGGGGGSGGGIGRMVPPQDLMLSPRFIDVQGGKISLRPPKQHIEATISRDREVLEARIAELEDTLARLQDRINQSQRSSPTLEKKLKEQLDSMNRAMKSKDRRAMQACREHKTLQAQFVRQDICLELLQKENKSLHQRVHQYEHCLDDVMRKVVDAIVAEDSLREEVSMLKNRVRDLEAQNAVLLASPAKGRDEGYCTMSSGQPQPSAGHLEDLPEEPEQWLISAEPCTAEMEDWSMSQEELGAAIIEDEQSDWLWNSSNFISSISDTQTDEIAALLQEPIIYSEDEEVACKDFTRDFYRLVNIGQPGSTRSLHSPGDDEGSDTSSEGGRTERLSSPTASEAGLAQVSSCSSSESSDATASVLLPTNGSDHRCTGNLLQEVLTACQKTNAVADGAHSVPPSRAWRKSIGWRRVTSQSKVEKKKPPPVPVRKSFVS